MSIVYGTMTLEVTERHIKKGKRKKPDRCPVQLAAADVFKDFSMDADEVRNPYLAAWIRRFDAGLSVLPFTLTIPIGPGDGSRKAGTYINERVRR